jgi:hypothetical protein
MFENLLDITVKVPTERVADFYAMYGRWLGSSELDVIAEPADASQVQPWSATDTALAKTVWDKFSDRAKAVYSTFIDHPGKSFTGEELAQLHDIPNGKYGIAGVLAWPGRHCAAVQRHLPNHYQEGPVGGSASYWMDEQTAALFRNAREGR